MEKIRRDLASILQNNQFNKKLLSKLRTILFVICLCIIIAVLIHRNMWGVYLLLCFGLAYVTIEDVMLHIYTVTLHKKIINYINSNREDFKLYYNFDMKGMKIRDIAMDEYEERAIAIQFTNRGGEVLAIPLIKKNGLQAQHANRIRSFRVLFL